MHTQPPAKAAGAIVHGDVPVSRRICETVVNLPLFYGIRRDECDASIDALLAAVRA
jgi:dTDP-4-amino-4,6-dideoxygalactose transaminase